MDALASAVSSRMIAWASAAADALSCAGKLEHSGYMLDVLSANLFCGGV